MTNYWKSCWIGLVLLTINMVVCAATTITGAYDSPGTLMQWHKVTLTIDGPSSSEGATPNPCMDYRMNVTFTHPGTGTTYVVPGYFAADGNAANTSATSGNKWRAHLCPDYTGTWNYTISFRQATDVAVNDSPTAGTAVSPYDGMSDSFTVIATNKSDDKSARDFRGKGRLTYVGGHFLQFVGNGEYFFKQGADAPENFLAYRDFDGPFKSDGNGDGYLKTWSAHVSDWSSGSDPSWSSLDGTPGTYGEGIIGAINYLASEGLNAFSFLPMNINGDDKNVFPYTNYGERNRMDCSKLDQWEIVLEHGDKLGMFLHFKTQETENELLLNSGNLGNQRKLYYRTLVARFSHHLALNWNLGEEINDSSTAQKVSWAQYFFDIDPYHHHIVIHNMSDPHYDLLGSASKLTGFSKQTNQTNFSNVFSGVKDYVDRSATAGKKWAVACDEPGDAQHALRPDYDAGSSHIDGRKNGLWDTFMAGGYGNEWYFGYAHDHSDLSCQDWRSRNAFWDYCRYALQFFSSSNAPDRKPVPAQNMSNADWRASGSNNRCLYGVDAQGKPCLVVYAKYGGSFTVDAPAASLYNVGWMNPQSGIWYPASDITNHSGGTISFTPPVVSGADDWALLLYDWFAVTDTEPPSPNPAEWQTPPTATGDRTITMQAVICTDALSNPVQYSFTETLGNCGGTSSGWQTSPTYTLTNLAPGTEYCFYVTARDSRGNETGSSAEVCVTTTGTPDTTPPSPDPVTFEVEPLVISETEILMIANISTDETGPVQYYFEETTGNPGGSDSGWQTSREYLNVGLTGGYEYTYTVRARDAACNETTPSAGLSATTPAPQTTELTFAPTDDAFIENTTTYNNNYLKIQPSSPTRVAYLKFDVTGIPVDYDVTGVTIALTVNGDSGSGTLRVYQGSHNNWYEETITSTSAPATGIEVGSVTGSFGNVEIDVTPLVTGNGVVSMVIMMDSGGNDVWFGSKESANAPVLTVVAGLDQPGENLLTDPGFETGVIGDWTGGAWGINAVNSTEQRTGDHCGTVGDLTNAGGIGQRIPLQPLTEYTYSAWVKVAETSTDTARLGQKEYGVAESSVSTSSTDYVKLTHTFTTGPAPDASAGVVYLWIPAGGQAYGDDFVLLGPGGDIVPPADDPPEWDIQPYAVDDHSIAMSAVAGLDDSLPIQYNFVETSGNCGAADSGWQYSRTYVATGLAPGTQYCYTVQMRDKFSNETAASIEACATTTGTLDIYPPSLDPADFEAPPTAINSNSIMMTAIEGIDTNGVEYYFDETSGNPGGSDSGWQTSRTYIDIGLAEGTCYSYTVQMRDTVCNEGTVSTEVTTCTRPGIDIIKDDFIDELDLLEFVARWLDTDCFLDALCGGTDLDASNTVDMDDFLLLSQSWWDDWGDAVSPKVYFKLDEASGMTAVDSSRYNHDGTLHNMDDTDWVSGRLSNALDFDGVDDYVEISGFQGITGTAGRTCVAWIKTTMSGTGNILSWGTSVAGQKWMFRVESDGLLGVGIWDGFIRTTNTAINDGQWHLVAAVLADDGSPSLDEIQLYVDGTLIVDTYASNSQSVITSDTENMIMGARLDTDGMTPVDHFEGEIDDVRVYDQALTQTQIMNIMNTKDSIVELHLDEAGGNVANDSSEHNHDGTLFNMDNSDWVPGKIGNALDFDGVDDRLAIQGYQGVSGSASRTCMAWVNTTAGQENQIISWGAPADGQKWMFRVESDGSLGVGVWAGYIHTTSQLINDGTWHHVAAVLADDGNPSVDEIQLFIDGVRITEVSANNNQPVLTSDAETVIIGARLDTDGVTYVSHYDGQIDDVRIYDKALSQDRIVDVYNEASGPTGQTYILNATTDFPTYTGIAGFVPAYIDAAQSALAINAATYKDEWAAAQTTFTGLSGTYDFKLISLLETDGESSYLVKINGVAIGSAKQNISTGTDYVEHEHIWSNVSINSGDQIQVEFNTHSNGLIPEGDGFAYSRGRWRRLILDGGGTVTPPTGVFIESEGLVIMECENTETAQAQWDEWQLVTPGDSRYVSGATNDAHLEFTGNTINGGNPNDPLVYTFQINQSGNYQLHIRSRKRLEGEASDKCNDCYVKMEGNFTSGNPSAAESALRSDTKLYGGDPSSWGWAQNLDSHDADHTPAKYNFIAGETYTFTVSGRSIRYNMDRIIFRICEGANTVAESYAKDSARPESQRIQ